MENITVGEEFEMINLNISDNNNIYNFIELSLAELNTLRTKINKLISEKYYKDVKPLQKIYENKRSNLILYIIINKNKISDQQKQIYDNMLYD